MMGAVGVIGGSGLYQLEGLERIERVALKTPFGDPSDAFITGVLHGRRMVFLPRHGSGHRILPHEINYRANIWGLKKLGVDRVISISAVGSMNEAIAPGHLVMVDQYIDLTRRRTSTFFGEGVVVHIPFADPVCGSLHGSLIDAGRSIGATVHERGTYLCIDGPQFSTRAESMLYRQWGVSVIGMTNLPEAKLAREAELCYASVALATDYDCWHETQESVSVEAVLKILAANVERAKALILAYVKGADERTGCSVCTQATRTSLMTPPELIPARVRQDLDPIFSSFLPRA